MMLIFIKHISLMEIIKNKTYLKTSLLSVVSRLVVIYV